MFRKDVSDLGRPSFDRMRSSSVCHGKEFCFDVHEADGNKPIRLHFGSDETGTGIDFGMPL